MIDFFIDSKKYAGSASTGSSLKSDTQSSVNSANDHDLGHVDYRRKLKVLVLYKT